jgi:hypothetical protein
MGAVFKKVGIDVIQKSLMKVVELSAKKYSDMTGQPLSKEQRAFLIGVVAGLSDAVITSVRTGKIKPMDVAQLAVGNALEATGLLKDKSAAGNYMDCGLALVALALTSTETYGILVTASATAAVAAPETGGLSLAGDAGIIIVGILYWNYIVLDTTMRCVDDFNKIEKAVPAQFDLPSKRQNYTNAPNACMMR